MIEGVPLMRVNGSADAGPQEMTKLKRTGRRAAEVNKQRILVLELEVKIAGGLERACGPKSVESELQKGAKKSVYSGHGPTVACRGDGY
jgi:hypothetical protein